MCRSKIAPAVLKKILGHSDITITMQYYVDVDNNFISSENENVEKYLIENNIYGIDISTEDKIVDNTKENRLEFVGIQ